MKNLIIIIILSSMGLAQTNRSSVNVSVSATIQDYLDMITLADIDVGTVIPSDDRLVLNPQTDQGAGIIMIRGRENASIQVGYSAQVEMINQSTSSTLLVQYSVFGNAENLQSSSTILELNPETVTLSGGGEYFLYIGCSFGLANLEQGQYDGDFVIEVDYN